MNDNAQPSPWDGDLLGYAAVGTTYTKLIKSIDDSKVISIEAGFGHGKTFFRKAWAKQLAAEGEIVVEIDAQVSDHSGDPVVTFLGALLALVPEGDNGDARNAVWEHTKRVGVVGSKILVNALVRGAADQIADAFNDGDDNQTAGEKTLEEIADGIGSEMSDYLGGLIAHQLRVDEARVKELPEQLGAIFKAITKDKPNQRIVVIIDELDRCHPDYAIALLEAMKLVFGYEGFVFVLMVNERHLEALANRRFADALEGERYIDKFVDIRLQLPKTEAAFSAAAAQVLRDTCPVFTPLHEDRAFSTEFAAELTGLLAPASELSMRQVKRVLMKVEIALRCHPEEPLDLPLLVYLAFHEATETPDAKFKVEWLRRRDLTPQTAQSWLPKGKSEREYRRLNDNWWAFAEKIPEIGEYIRVNRNQFHFRQHGEARLWAEFAENYIPRHLRILQAVHTVEPPDG